MSLGRKAQQEAEAAQLKQLQEYRELQGEAYRFWLGKMTNQNVPGALPHNMWRDWQNWKNKLHYVDKKYEKFYK